jgi:predicted DNA-binding protein (MmcQ/YjbR family)
VATRVVDKNRAASAEKRVLAVVSQMDSVEEETAWDHPTFRIEGEIFAALHESGLILRCTKAESREFPRDARFSKAPYWGRFGWVCVDIRKVPASELKTLLKDAAERVSPKAKRS